MVFGFNRKKITCVEADSNTKGKENLFSFRNFLVGQLASLKPHAFDRKQDYKLKGLSECASSGPKPLEVRS